MGKSNSVEQMVGKVRRAGESAAKVKQEQLVAIGEQMVDVHEEVVDQVLGGDGFSGWEENPLVGVSLVSSAGVTFKPKARARGSERVGESGRHEGMFGPMFGPMSTKTGKASRRRRRKWNGTTKGHKTWTLTIEADTKIVPPKLKSAFVAPMKEIFR